MADRLMSDGKKDKKAPVEKLLSGPATENKVKIPAFDLAAWVAGQGMATTSHRIYGNRDLFGKRQALGPELEAARAAGDTARVKALKAEINELTVALQSDYIDFELVALTRSRREELIEALNDSDEEDPTILALYMLAEQISAPAGVTVEQLLVLAEWDVVQVNELVSAMNALNSRTPNVGATRPF